MKIGDRAKGFKFTYHKNSAGLGYHERMEKHVGMSGTIVDIRQNVCFTIEYESGAWSWSYPVKEYLSIQRENKLKELDI